MAITKFTLNVPSIGYQKTIELRIDKKDIIKPENQLMFYLIIWGLTKEESKYVILNKNGFIDRDNLLLAQREINSLSDNFKCLIKLSESKKIIEIKLSNYFETNKKKTIFQELVYVNPLDEDYENYKEMMKNYPNAVVSKKQYAIQNGYPTENKKEWGGIFAVTIYPDTGIIGTSKNDKYQIVFNKSFLKIKEKKEALMKMTSIFAHEAYGHLYFKIMGKPHSHGKIKSLSDDSDGNNKELEIHIKNREDEACKNFNLYHSDSYSKFL